MNLSLVTRPGRNCLIVQLGGVLDLATAPDVHSGLQDAVAGDARTVVLDLADVRLVDSTALGMIVALHHQLQERGGRVCVVRPQPLVRSVFQITSVDRLIDLYDSVEAAEDAASAGR